MQRGLSNRTRSFVAGLALAASAVIAGEVAQASAPPVGPLPRGQVTVLRTTTGSLIAVALPSVQKGYVWRLARRVDPAVAVEVSEGSIDRHVVVLFKARGRGKTAITFGLTRGETSKAVHAVVYSLTVGPP
jgi:hypothetical protein